MSATALKGALASGLPVPGLGQAGDFQISGLRITSGGSTLLDAPGKTVSLRCLGEVLISSVTSTPMTLDEIRAAGVQLGQGDFNATRFTLALSFGSNKVNLKVPVAIPVYNGLDSPFSDPQIGRLELEGDPDMAPDLQVALADLTPPGDFTLSRPEIAHLATHAFKSLVVIPGSIGYLHQFFKVNLIVLNALPKGQADYAGYRVGKLLGTLAIPPAESTSLTARSDLTQSLRGDSGDSVGPGESASGIWVIEGLDLSSVEPGRYELACLPLRLLGADGAPARAALRKL